MTTDTVVPIYNEFSYNKLIQLFLVKMSSVKINNTFVPIYNEFSYHGQYIRSI